VTSDIVLAVWADSWSWRSDSCAKRDYKLFMWIKC